MIFQVATFYDVGPGRPVRSRVNVYTRMFNPAWPGCIVYEVEAASAKEARRMARDKRFDYEVTKWVGVTPRRGGGHDV